MAIDPDPLRPQTKNRMPEPLSGNRRNTLVGPTLALPSEATWGRPSLVNGAVDTTGTRCRPRR